MSSPFTIGLTPPVLEAKAEEKNIKQSVKSLNQVEKAEAKAAKAEQQAEKVSKDHRFGRL